jgi:hypothetical protein
MFGIVFYSTYWGLFRFKRFHSSYKMRSSAKVKYLNFQKSTGTRTLYSWLATNLLLVHTIQCSLIKSQNRHDMAYLFCDKIFFCAMPHDMGAPEPRGAGTTGRRNHGGNCPCCPNNAGAARGQQVALFTGTAVRNSCVIHRNLNF